MTGHHLILGGCGFIGRHVALFLAQMGHKVVIADRVQPDFKFPAGLEEKISWRRLEFVSAEWDKLIRGADVIYHYVWMSLPATANSNPSGDLSANVGGTLALLEAVRRRGEGRIVFASSGGTVYGRLHQQPVTEDHQLMPTTAYGAGKATAEIYLGLYRSLHGVDCRVARIANPYGVGQAIARGQGAVTTFLDHALNNQPIVIWGDGEVVRDYIHVTDVAEAMVILALRPQAKDFHTYNIGSGVGLSLNNIITEIESALSRRLDVRREEGRAFDIPVSVLDISRARNALGWSPKLGFREGIARTLRDLQNGLQLSSQSNGTVQ